MLPSFPKQVTDVGGEGPWERVKGRDRRARRRDRQGGKERRRGRNEAASINKIHQVWEGLLWPHWLDTPSAPIMTFPLLLPLPWSEPAGNSPLSSHRIPKFQG